MTAVHTVGEGKVSNSCGTNLPGVSTMTFALGCMEMYEFLNENPPMGFASAPRVNGSAPSADRHPAASSHRARTVSPRGLAGSDQPGATARPTPRDELHFAADSLGR